MPLAQETERIVEQYSDMLLRIALHNTSSRSDAEDAVQTVFLKYLKLQPEFVDEGHEKAWFIRVAINQCRDLTKSAWHRKTVPLQDYTHCDGPAEDTRDDRRAVLDTVRALPEKYRNIIYLYYYEGYTTANIAKLLGIPRNTVESRLYRARGKMRTMLEEA